MLKIISYRGSNCNGCANTERRHKTIEQALLLDIPMGLWLPMLLNISGWQSADTISANVIGMTLEWNRADVGVEVLITETNTYRFTSNTKHRDNKMASICTSRDVKLL
jgi:hypothetical protein